MEPVILSATFDGQHIQLDGPYALPLHARLLVTLLPTEPDPEHEAFLRLAAQSLACAYGPNEPDYTLADLGAAARGQALGAAARGQALGFGVNNLQTSRTLFSRGGERNQALAFGVSRSKEIRV